MTVKPPASGGLSTAGAAFIEAGNEIRYVVDAPEAISHAKVVLRFARLHFRESMSPARLAVKVRNAGQEAEVSVSLGNTGGWGTNKAKEWAFETADLGIDLKPGKVELTLTALEDNSNVNIDGFFLASADFDINTQETSSLERIILSGNGYVGLEIAGDTVFPGAFDGFRVVGRSFSGKAQPVQVRVQGEDGKSLVLRKREAMSLANTPSALDFRSEALDSLSDGPYELEVLAGVESKRLTYPLYVMRNLVETAREKSAEYRQKAQSFLDRQALQEQWKLIPDLNHAAEYMENSILVLEARQRGENVTSERAAALAYFERSRSRTARDFANDIESLIAQTEASIERAARNESAYEGRVGDMRRAFYSSQTGALEPYRIYVPSAYEKLEIIPLIVMLHGGGGDENYFPDLDDGDVVKVLEERPYLMISPRCTSGYRGAGGEDIKQLIDATLKAYPKVDPSRIYCTGVSAGGGGTWYMAMNYPEIFRAIAPVSSGPRVTDEVERLNGMPVLIIHGAQDVVSSPDRAREAAEELKKRNHPSKLLMFPEYGHEYHGREYLELTLDYFESHIGQ